MSKLYYTPTSCSASCFISAYRAGVSIPCEQVNLATHTLANGFDYYKINPKGNVPALQLEDGTVLHENSAVFLWIADQAPGKVAPASGDKDRHYLYTVLNYISSELHPTMGALFSKTIHPEVRKYFIEKLGQKLSYIEKEIVGDRTYLVGENFTIADAYMYIVLSWHQWLNVDLTQYTKTLAYWKRISELPFVFEAHARMASNAGTTF